MNCKENKAFTLSELLIAAFILTIVLLGVIAVITNTLRLNQLNRNMVCAAFHAQQVIEKMKTSGFGSLESNINSGNWNLNSAALAQNPYNFALLSNESVSTSVIQSGNPLGVSVQVNWNEPGQDTRSFSLQTLITNF